MEKYGNKTPLMRFVHKYTGYIIIGGILAIAIPLYLDYDKNANFWERWTCPMMEKYRDGNATENNILYKDLPDETKLKFNEVLNREC